MKNILKELKILSLNKCRLKLSRVTKMINVIQSGIKFA